MKRFKWLYPGMHIKRWLLLFVLGLLLCLLGLIAVIDSAQLVKMSNAVLKLADVLHNISLFNLLIFAGLGLLCMMIAVFKLIASIAVLFIPEEESLTHAVCRRRQLGRGPKIVAIGGGTGIPVLLRGLKQYTNNLTAIITVTDNGGSSGRLRDELHIPSPGDIRNCLVALASAEPLMQKLFQYRFNTVNDLVGHSFGNLFIAAMTQITGDFELAIKESSRVLAVQGRVLPSTVEDVVLCAEMQDRQRLSGECQIVDSDAAIARVFLEPADPEPLPEAIRAILEADLIIIGPGSLYTSVMPNLLIPQIADALKQTKATRIYICNIMTQRGETDGYTAAQHVEAIFDHVGNVIDYVILNARPISQETKYKYHEQDAYPVVNDREHIESLGLKVVAADVISEDDTVRHDADKLSHEIIRILNHKRFAGRLNALSYRKRTR